MLAEPLSMGGSDRSRPNEANPLNEADSPNEANHPNQASPLNEANHPNEKDTLNEANHPNEKDTLNEANHPNQASPPAWKQAHEALVGFALERAGLDFEEGECLLAASRAGVHRRLGFASFVEYVERLFGYAPRVTQDKLRVASALEQLPLLAADLRLGQTNWSSVRELTRVATAKTEQAWREAARGRTVREVERLVSGRAPGSLPTDAADEGLRRHVLRFEVSGDVLATFRDAMAKLREESGGPLDDDAALLLMARHVLGGPLEEGRASYQVELTLCEDCQRARQQGGGALIEVPNEVTHMARCDAQHVGAGAGPKAQRAKQAIPPAMRRGVLRRDQHRCVVPGCRHATFVDLHHVQAREEGGQHHSDNLVTLCSAHHRAVHRGELSIVGPVSSGLRFWHADGSEYGDVEGVAVSVADRQSQAFRALKRLGFRDTEARSALAASRAHVGDDGDVKTILREALRLLSEASLSKAS